MATSISRNKLIVLVIALFAGLSAWWLWLYFGGYVGETDQAERFSSAYGVMALCGGLIGLSVSKKWGGFKSLIGKFTIFISLGLLAQEFGQITYSLYTYLFHVEIPYPSVGDVGYFGSVVFYCIAVIYLIKALKLKTTLTSTTNKILVVLIPLILLGSSYFFFLSGNEYDFSHPLTVFLDFGYPLGQVFYISLALLAFTLSMRYLGGIMKSVILFLIFALFAQYVSDFTFLYSVSRKTWETAGINEYTYLVSYFIMTLALLQLGGVINRLNNPSFETVDSRDVEKLDTKAKKAAPEEDTKESV